MYPSSPHYFGFHATLKGTFRTQKLSHLREQIATLVKDFKPIRIGGSFLHSFNARSRVVCFRADSSEQVILHKLHKLILQVVDENRTKGYVPPETVDIMDQLGKREIDLLQMYGDPRVLDEYVFHFTLANRADHERIMLMDKLVEPERRRLFGVSIVIDSICLVVQEEQDPYWKVVEEYRFKHNVD